ncbi:hypothetical protein K6119_02440 [Paracrocinitomix mangrovi]|uniref:hypothetical protein n=1 Tax=Paracrocinitomix mangrovi TaxID=2862509 RepID=UPI001C8EA8BC|nr:hypothetical protein [Paracrocinitomix mangrovi]UKN02379.1 hypothetical protein K6119_02440 [Paracrocinitomix mangrovi]
MNLEEIKNNIIKSAQEKLNRHRVMGAKTKLSIMEVAELLDIISGNADNARVAPGDLIGNYSLN